MLLQPEQNKNWIQLKDNQESWVALQGIVRIGFGEGQHDSGFSLSDKLTISFYYRDGNVTQLDYLVCDGKCEGFDKDKEYLEGLIANDQI